MGLNGFLPLWALVGILVERSWGSIGASWAVLERSSAILAALVTSQVRLGSHLGHLGRRGERHGRVFSFRSSRAHRRPPPHLAFLFFFPGQV